MTDVVVEITDDLTSDVIEIVDQGQSSVVEIENAVADAVIEIVSVETLPGAQGPTGPAGSSGVTILAYTAGATLSGHRTVVLDADAMAVYADNTVAAHANKVVGMTTGAVMIGESASIQTGGEMIEPSWAWTLDVPVWLGATGLLTQTAPVSGFSLIVGFPITATKIFVDIGEPIFLI